MRQIVYSVHKTNADQEELSVEYKGVSRDIAETKLMMCFVDGNCDTDYMMLSHSGQEFVCALYSAKTLALRGECGA